MDRAPSGVSRLHHLFHRYFIVAKGFQLKRTPHDAIYPIPFFLVNAKMKVSQFSFVNLSERIKFL